MAAASGQPQDTKPKKEVTAEQRKLYGALALIGLAVLISGVIYGPGLLHGSSTPPDSGALQPVGNGASSTTPGATGNSAGGPVVQLPGQMPGQAGVVSPGSEGAPGGAVSAGGATLTSATTPSAHVGPPAKWKPDPFAPDILYPTPTPAPPPPVDIPAPRIVPILLPGGRFKASDAGKIINLPQITLARDDIIRNRPTDAFPPRRSAGPGGGAEVVTPSFDKRLSGVIIGDGVRALLEITGPNGITTKVVQPGDEVDGITVLNIQRFNDGQRTVTRMLIRENGEERSVELRAGVQLQNPNGEGGLTGSGLAGSQGFPGGAGFPGGFQNGRGGGGG